MEFDRVKNVRITLKYELPIGLQISRVRYMANNDTMIKPNILCDHLGCFTPYGLYLI